MKRFVTTCLVIVLACSTTRAADDKEKEAIKKIAKEMADATLKGEYDKLIDKTYPKVVEALGGREKAIEFTKTSMESFKKQGLEIKEFTVGEPGEFVKDGDNSFIVIPTAVVMKLQGMTIKSKSYFLGISSDGGKSWKFADGAGLKNKEAIDKLLPKLPEKLKLPEPTTPEVTKD